MPGKIHLTQDHPKVSSDAPATCWTTAAEVCGESGVKILCRIKTRDGAVDEVLGCRYVCPYFAERGSAARSVGLCDIGGAHSHVLRPQWRRRTCAATGASKEGDTALRKWLRLAGCGRTSRVEVCRTNPIAVELLHDAKWRVGLEPSQHLSQRDTLPAP